MFCPQGSKNFRERGSNEKDVARSNNTNYHFNLQAFEGPRQGRAKGNQIGHKLVTNIFLPLYMI